MYVCGPSPIMGEWCLHRPSYACLRPLSGSGGADVITEITRINKFKQKAYLHYLSHSGRAEVLAEASLVKKLK